MKITSKTIALRTAAILALALAGSVRAAEYNKDEKMSAPPAGDNQLKTSESTPAKVNKASGIIGMDVRNQLDEHLGRIKDVVFDLSSERVSYAVMTASGTGFLGLNEKLLAVPLSALKISPDQKHFVLNAEKSKIAAAQGFDRNNWPGVGSPSWGAQPFWESAPAKTDTGNQPAAAAPAAAAPVAEPAAAKLDDVDNNPKAPPLGKPNLDDPDETK